MHTTKVINAETNYNDVLSLVYSAVVRMTEARIGYSAGKCSMMVVVNKDADNSGWSSTSPDVVSQSLSFDKFPRSDTSKLYLLEDLGRGSTGKVWLAATNAAVCVLKYSNKAGDEAFLSSELGNWHKVYPEFKARTSVEKWSASFALKMPHFTTIAVNRRSDFYLSIAILLKTFQGKGFIHNDVHWRNIGAYKQKGGADTPVLYDLAELKPYSAGEHDDWITKAMKCLFPEPPTAQLNNLSLKLNS